MQMEKYKLILAAMAAADTYHREKKKVITSLEFFLRHPEEEVKSGIVPSLIWQGTNWIISHISPPEKPGVSSQLSGTLQTLENSPWMRKTPLETFVQILTNLTTILASARWFFHCVFVCQNVPTQKQTSCFLGQRYERAVQHRAGSEGSPSSQMMLHWLAQLGRQT